MNTDRCTGVRVLFAGEYWPGANAAYIATAFTRSGAIVRHHDDLTTVPMWGSVPGKVAFRLLRRPLLEREWNRELRMLARSFDPDLVFICGGYYCHSDTLEELRARNVPVACMFFDPVWDKRRGHFASNLSRFDLVLSPRAWQVDEFRNHGARDVMHIRFGYEPLVHRPVSLDRRAKQLYEAQACLIASYRRRRGTILETLLAKSPDLNMKLWGAWHRAPAAAPYRRHWQGRTVHEQEIPVVYAASDVALHFVHHDPSSVDVEVRRGDEHNSRTFQIAACGGGILVAQRTAEHQAFFEEGREAVFFDDGDELADRLDYWLNPTRDTDRRKMAAAARQRCIDDDYSYRPLARKVLQYFDLPLTN